MVGVAMFLTVILASNPGFYEQWNDRLESTNLHHVTTIQECFWPLTGERIERQVEVWFAPPNRFKACYSPPDSQQIIADGATVWTIVPDNEQALVQAQDPHLTWKDTPLGEILSAGGKNCVVDSAKIGEDPGELWMECSGFDEQGPWEKISIVIDAGGFWPSRVLLEDISGNKTTYSVLKWEEKPLTAEADTLFDVVIPSGIEVIRLD